MKDLSQLWIKLTLDSLRTAWQNRFRGVFVPVTAPYRRSWPDLRRPLARPHFERAMPVGTPDPCTLRMQAMHHRRIRVAERVALSHRNQRRAWIDCGNEGVRRGTAAAMMPDHQDVAGQAYAAVFEQA